MKKVIKLISVFVACFAVLFVIASCDNSTNDNKNQDTSNVTPTNPDDSSKTEPSSPETDDNVYYTITFKDYDGTVLQTSSVKKGDTPAYNKSNPSRDRDDNYSYTFIGWDKELSKVTGDTTYIAQYETTINKYTVTWKNYDETVLEIDSNVEYGQIPTYDGDTPVREFDGTFSYSFIGWDKEILEVTGDVSYIAKYSASNNFIFEEIVDSNNVVTSYKFMGLINKSENVTIPSIYKEKPVTSFVKNAINLENTKMLVIPDSIKTIERGALSNCLNLEKISLHHFKTIDNDTGINLTSFSALFSKEFKEGLKSITSYDENGTSSYYSYVPKTLKQIEVDSNTIPNYAFKSFSLPVSIKFSNLTEIGVSSFDSTGITLFEFDYTCKNVKFSANAFYKSSTNRVYDVIFNVDNWFDYIFENDKSNPLSYCKTMNSSDSYSIKIPEKTTVINEYSFYNCICLEEVELNSKLELINEKSFYGCVGLYRVYNNSKLNLEYGSSTNGYVSFYAIKIYTGSENSLKTILFDDCVFIEDNGTYSLHKYIGTNTEVTLPNLINDNQYSIDNGAFANAKFIRKLVIPETVNYIDFGALSGCANLEEIVVPYIGSSLNEEKWDKVLFGYIFGDKKTDGFMEIKQQYKNATYPNPMEVDIKRITYVAPTSLKKITILGGHLTNGAFSGMSNVNEIILNFIYDEVPAYCFYNCSNLNFKLAENVKCVGDKSFSGCEKSYYIDEYSNIYIPSMQNNYFALIKGVSTRILRMHEGTILIGYAAYYEIPLFILDVPKGVKYIGDYSFYNEISPLVSVSLPTSLILIGKAAFSCSHTSSQTDTGHPVYLKNNSSLSMSEINKTRDSSNLPAYSFTTTIQYKIEGDWIIGTGSNHDASWGYLGNDTIIYIPSSIKVLTRYWYMGCTYHFEEIHTGSGVNKIKNYSIPRTKYDKELGSYRELDVYIDSSVNYIAPFAFEEGQLYSRTHIHFAVTSSWKVYNNDNTSTPYASVESSSISNPTTAYSGYNKYYSKYWKR